MALHHKRPRSHAGLDAPLDTYTPVVDAEFGQLPFVALQLPVEQVAPPYSYFTGDDVQEQSFFEIRKRKRTRIDEQEQTAMTEIYASASTTACLEKEPCPGFDQRQNHSCASCLPRCSSSCMDTVQNLNSPLARMAELLCPGCGIGWEQPSTYQPLPQSSEMVYDPTQPYSMQEAPSMTIQPTSQHVGCSQNSPQSNSFGYDQLGSHAPPLSSYPILGQLPFQPLSVDIANGNHQTNHAVAHHNTEPLAQPETQVSSMTSDSSSLHYAPALISIPSYTPFLSHDSSPVEVIHRYGPIPMDGLPGHSSLAGWGDVMLQGQGSNFDILLPNQRGGKRGPFRDQSLREQTAQTRKIGSCIRCRMQRIRCEHNPDDPSGGCLTCKKVANTKAGRFPCLRYKIPDIRLYKPGQVPGYEWTRRWINNISDPIQRWDSPEIKIIRISEGFSDKCIELRVRKFVPQDGDKLNRTWDFNGTTKSVAIPPYALMDLEDGKAAYARHILDCMSDIFRKVLGRNDGLLYKTYLQAWHIIKEPKTSKEVRELLTSTLRLWVSIRLSTTSGFIVGEETLGMPNDILDITSPSPGKVPIPPVLGAQMDLILIHHIQTKLRRDLLDKLQKMILSNKQSNWLVTYLVTFILLHNAALITEHDARYAKKHGMKRRFARQDKVQEYHLGANILLAHFHYCNKGVHPFSDECKDQDLRTLANLDDNKIQFVRATRAYAKRHKQEWETIRTRRDYEDEYFFVSQLFEEGWQPRSTDS